jgi:threonine dehydrogenase-like Zn-dependent dehydrogenase
MGLPRHQPGDGADPIGHEYCGVVEEVGRDVASIRPGQFVIGSFFASDGTCPNCRAGFQSSCLRREFVGGAQAEALRVPLADGVLSVILAGANPLATGHRV